MLISVIIPTFNRSDFVIKAIESVLTQSYKDFELIIVDDGSTDDTQERLSSYIAEGVVSVFKTENRGVSAARNFGLSQAKGEWVAFLDSDDIWHPNKLEVQAKYIQDHPKFELVHGEELWIRNGKRINPKKKFQKSGGDIFSKCLDFCVISPSVAIMKKSLLESFGGFREDFIVCEDYDLWLKVTSRQEVGYISEALVSKMGGHSDQLSTKFFAMDYWRIKSLGDILNKGHLNQERLIEVASMIEKKGSVLITGYLKHDNLKDLHEIKTIVETAHQVKEPLLKE
ncbi:MAG: hypothetical protein BM556_01865 [Bacteriovorax sp. MedPE-SWde]|nr:MAG: hypothetical protein BM556_01865 [Bacteriovorax sp. MedPE-SWde]